MLGKIGMEKRRVWGVARMGIVQVAKRTVVKRSEPATEYAGQ